MIFPLNISGVIRKGDIMLIRNPCKRCIVQACCHHICEDKQNYFERRDKIRDIIRYTILGTIGAFGILFLAKGLLLLLGL